MSELYPVNIFQYISLRDMELTLNTITACYMCCKENSHKSCVDCFNSLINSIISNGRHAYERHFDIITDIADNFKHN